jgi:glycosyltransferase involved in cell wall biosynthesis
MIGGRVGTSTSRCLMDLSIGNKGAERIRQGLIPALEQYAPESGLEFDYLLPHQAPAITTRGLSRNLLLAHDFVSDEMALPFYARDYGLVYTFREPIRVPRRRTWVLVQHIHEHPLNRYVPAPNLPRALLGGWRLWRRTVAYHRADFVLFSSHWSLVDFQQWEGPLRTPTRVAHLSGWPDDHVPAEILLSREPYVVAMVSSDLRDDLHWLRGCWKSARLNGMELLLIGGTSSFPSERIRAMGWVSDRDLMSIMRRSTAYLHSGQFEGFGIAVVEALQLGVPVVAPDSSALVEVLADGGGALALSPEEAGARLREIVVDRDARERARLNGARFSWRRTAQIVIESLQRALSA